MEDRRYWLHSICLCCIGYLCIWLLIDNIPNGENQQEEYFGKRQKGTHFCADIADAFGLFILSLGLSQASVTLESILTSFKSTVSIFQIINMSIVGIFLVPSVVIACIYGSPRAGE